MTDCSFRHLIPLLFLVSSSLAAGCVDPPDEAFEVPHFRIGDAAGIHLTATGHSSELRLLETGTVRDAFGVDRAVATFAGDFAVALFEEAKDVPEPGLARLRLGLDFASVVELNHTSPGQTVPLQGWVVYGAPTRTTLVWIFPLLSWALQGETLEPGVPLQGTFAGLPFIARHEGQDGDLHQVVVEFPFRGIGPEEFSMLYRLGMRENSAFPLVVEQAASVFAARSPWTVAATLTPSGTGGEPVQRASWEPGGSVTWEAWENAPAQGELESFFSLGEALAVVESTEVYQDFAADQQEIRLVTASFSYPTQEPTLRSAEWYDLTFASTGGSEAVTFAVRKEQTLEAPPLVEVTQAEATQSPGAVAPRSALPSHMVSLSDILNKIARVSTECPVEQGPLGPLPEPFPAPLVPACEVLGLDYREDFTEASRTDGGFDAMLLTWHVSSRLLGPDGSLVGYRRDTVSASAGVPISRALEPT